MALSHISGLFIQKLAFSKYQTLSKFFFYKTTSKNRWSLPKMFFVDVETTLRHTFPPSDLQCLPPDDPKVLYANTGIRLRGNYSLGSSLKLATCDVLIWEIQKHWVFEHIGYLCAWSTKWLYNTWLKTSKRRKYYLGHHPLGRQPEARLMRHPQLKSRFKRANAESTGIRGLSGCNIGRLYSTMYSRIEKP